MMTLTIHTQVGLIASADALVVEVSYVVVVVIKSKLIFSFELDKPNIQETTTMSKSRKENKSFLFLPFRR